MFNPRIFDAQSDKSKTAKLNNGSNDSHLALSEYKSLPVDIERATRNTNNNKNGAGNQQDKYETGPSQPLQIMRTVHIATTRDVDTVSALPDFDNQAASMSYEYHRH